MTVRTPAQTSDDHAVAPAWGLLLDLLREQRRGLGIATALGLVWTAGKVVSPILVRYGIDRGITEGDRLWMWAGLIAAAGLVVGTFTAIRRFISFKEARWTETRLREQLFRHIIRLHVGFHDRSQTGNLMSRASSDVQQVQGFVLMVPITLTNFVLIGVITVILLLTDPLLALLALGTLPLVQVGGAKFSRAVHPLIRAVQAEQAELATVVEESVGGVRVVKGFGAEQAQSDKLRREADDIQRVSIQAARVRAKYLPANDVLPQLGLIAVLGVGGLRVIDGQLTLGELVQFNIYVTMLVFPLRMIGMTIAWGQRASVALRRIREVLSVEPQIADPPPAQRATLPDVHSGTPVGRVRFADVSFSYDSPPPAPAGEPNTGRDAPDTGQTGQTAAAAEAEAEVERLNDSGSTRNALGGPVLDGFSLELEPGQSIAVVGATGSGKSTIARLLVRFYDADHGTIQIDGVDVRDLALDDLRRAVGVVFEDTLLFRASVRDNIAFAAPDATDDDVRRAAALAGADDFIDRLPRGYDTVIGERGFSLSGGQRQRVAIARAIVADPRVLVLDDATSAVDPSKEHEIRAAMATVMAGRTTIVIAHRPGTIALADSVILLDGGRVLASGPHETLLATSPRYREVLAALEESAAEPAPETAAVD